MTLPAGDRIGGHKLPGGVMNPGRSSEYLLDLVEHRRIEPAVLLKL